MLHMIGITGGIGSGKTTLSNLLRERGYLVYDSDLEARRLQNEHPELRRKLIKYFGTEIYNKNTLNRTLLAKLVFGDPEKLRLLTDIVHPVVENDIKLWMSEHTDQKLLFIESAILFENAFDKLVDKIILITSPEDIRISRVIRRDKVTEQQVRARMKHQIPDKEKIPLCDFVIYSDDNLPMGNRLQDLWEWLSKIEEE